MFSVDIWSVGCIMGEMIKGGVLFPGTDRILTLGLGYSCKRSKDTAVIQFQNKVVLIFKILVLNCLFKLQFAIPLYTTWANTYFFFFLFFPPLLLFFQCYIVPIHYFWMLSHLRQTSFGLGGVFLVHVHWVLLWSSFFMWYLLILFSTWAC